MDTLLLSIPDTKSGGWDLTLDANNNIALASSVDSTGGYGLAQDAASEIKTFQGEVYYDTTLGLPWLVSFLGKVPPTQLLKSAMTNAALLVTGVVTATVYFISFINRKLTGQVQITDENGNTTAANF
jgi:hypothetical protein